MNFNVLLIEECLCSKFSVEHSIHYLYLCYVFFALIALQLCVPRADTAQQLLTTQHTMSLRCVLLLAGLAAPALQDNVGWRSFLQENTQEFQDLPLAWQGDTQVPAWLSGTYVRNGPAQVGV